MGAIAKIKRGAKVLVTRHGAEVGVCAKVAVAALMPGGGGLPEVIHALCDNVNQKDIDALSDERVLELLGYFKENQEQVAVVIERLEDQLNDVMAQMVGMLRFNVPEEGLTHIIIVAISTRSELMAVRQELMGLQAEMSVFQAQHEEALRRQRFSGDVLSQLKHSINAALGFYAPLLREGVPIDKTHAFLQAHMMFQRCLVRGELREAEARLNTMTAISATSDTVKVCEITLRAMRRDFEGAWSVARTLSFSARGDARVGHMTRSLSSLTQSAHVITEWVLQSHLYEGLSSFFEHLSCFDSHLLYHIAEPGSAPEGPFKLSEVVKRVLAGSSEQLLWWSGANGWSSWREVREVKAAVDAARSMPTPAPTPVPTYPPTPTLPPIPRAPLKLLDRIEQKVGPVSFFERVIPAPPHGEAFLMMETQVTQALWEEVMGLNPSQFKGPQKPVETVTWEDSVKFANALSRKLGLMPAYSTDDNDARFVKGASGFRLPLEADWAFAARGGERFKFAGSDNLNEVGWYSSCFNPFSVSGGQGNVWDKQTQDVGQLKPNAYGLYDMSGNVWERCSDYYENPVQHHPGNGERVNRGGGWDTSVHQCAIASRRWGIPNERNHSLGLRLSRPIG